MLWIWLGLAIFTGFIAVRSFNEARYFRSAFAAFWFAMFLFSIWIDFQQSGAPVA